MNRFEAVMEELNNTNDCDCSHRAPMWAVFLSWALMLALGFLVGADHEKAAACSHHTCPPGVQPRLLDNACICPTPAKEPTP